MHDAATKLAIPSVPEADEPIVLPTYPAYGKIATVTIFAAMSLFAVLTWVWRD